MPKGPRGSTSHAVCFLRGSCFIGDYILGCLSTSEFWSVRKQMGMGDGGTGEDEEVHYDA